MKPYQNPHTNPPDSEPAAAVVLYELRIPGYRARLAKKFKAIILRPERPDLAGTGDAA